MYAIVEVGGIQYRVSPNDVIRTNKMNYKVGDNVTIDKVLLFSDGEKAQIGSPYITGANAKAEVLSHGKGDKVIIYKHKRRKNYRRKRGHRQNFTELKVKEIVIG